MEYIKDSDYDYIMNKYHDSSKPFDGFGRFIRRDEIFSHETGMDGEKIKEEILRRDREMKDFPRPIRKAMAFAYVLENTKISCDSHDPFPAINMIDRPLNSTIVQKWRNEVFNEIIPKTENKRAFLEKSGIVSIWPDYDHSVPMWDRIFDLGFAGLLEESERVRLSKTLTDKEDAFFEGIKITYSAIINFIGRIAELAAKTKGSEKMARALKNIQNNSPATFYEALLVDYIYLCSASILRGCRFVHFLTLIGFFISFI